MSRDASETLRLATLNVWALPFGIARHVDERMAAIGARLGELELDVAALEEVWTEEARTSLVAAGARAGLVHVWHKPEARGGSGLLLLSRRPLRDVAFHRYRLRGLPQRIHHGDYWSGKGFVRARVDTAVGPVVLAATHLHAQYGPDPDDEYRGIRTAQIVELAAGLKGLADPVIALGDFNVRMGNPDHAVLLGLTGLRDTALEVGHPQDTVLSPHPYRGVGHRGGERIDYVFVRTGTRADALPRRVERRFDAPIEVAGEPGAYSDHAGLRAEVAIEAVAPRTLPTADPRALARARALLEQGRAEARRRRGIERSLALGAGALAVAALPGAAQLRESRRTFLARLVTGLGIAAVPGAGLAAALSEVAVPQELAAFDAVESLLDGFLPAR